MRITDVLSALGRRWYFIAVCFLVCAGVAGVYSKITTKVYRADTLISVTPAQFDYGNGLAAQQLLANYAVALTGEQLLGQLNQQLNLDMPPALLSKEIQASADNTALTIALTVDDTDPHRAADIANGLTQLFVTTTQQYNLAHLNPDIDVQVIHSAEIPSSPNRPQTKINVLAGALVGLLLGCGAAYALDVWDDRLRTEHDVEAGLGLPLLGNIPPLPRAHASQQIIPSSNGTAGAPKTPEEAGTPIGGARR